MIYSICYGGKRKKQTRVWQRDESDMEYCRKERLKLINIDSTAGYSV